MSLTDDLPDDVLHVILHATGATQCLDRPTLAVGWRNRYCCGPAHPGYDACQQAVDRGLMRAEPDAEWLGTGDTRFHCAEAGLGVARAWVRERLRRRVWRVEYGSGDADLYTADTRSGARARAVAAIRDAWCCTYAEALREIRSVRRSA